MARLYKFADINISICSINSEIHDLCKDYQTEGTAEISVKIKKTDIEKERIRSINDDNQKGIPHRQFSDDYLETLAVYRQIAEKMPFFNVVLFHGSAISVDGQGYLFTAKSGTGKSTHTRLWRELLGERAVMVNDDKPLIRITDTDVIVYGTPWDGKHRLSNNIAVPLRSICILDRAEENSIREITKEEAYPMLVQQVYRPSDNDAMIKTLELIDRLDVRLYHLSCNMDISAAQLAFSTMKEG